MKKSPSWIGYVGAMIALLGLLFGAGQAWGDLTARVHALEQRTLYFFGSPTAGER